MAGHIIRQLEERHVARRVDLMVWCNKMDLLALSNSKGEVALHRLTWQRVWLLSPPSPDLSVRKIAWRPDGRVIAIAYVPKVMTVGEEIQGQVLLVDVENKDVLHTAHVTDDVSCLVWLQENQFQEYHQTWASASHSQDGTSDFLPKLPSLSRTFGSLPETAEENLEDAKRIKDQTYLNFLLIGTSDGNLYLSVFGLFSCGVMNVNKYMSEEDKEKHSSVLNAEMSQDMKSLILLVAVDKEKVYDETLNEDKGITKQTNLEVLKIDEDDLLKNATPSKTCESSSETQTPTESSKLLSGVEEKIEINTNTSTSGKNMHRKRDFKIVVLDTRVLSSRSRELHALSLKHGHIISLLDYLAQTMRSIIEAWENIYLLEIESKLSKHAESLPEGSLSADLLELLLFGITSESLENFLLNELNDKGIKKLGHSIELSHSNIQKLILKHLTSVGQSLAYHLAEMKGMAKLTDRFKVLGLEEDAVSQAFSAAGAFLIKSSEVQLVIDESMKKYKAFFKWLYAIILRLTDDRIPDLTMIDINQQDLEFIAEYLYKLDIKIDEDGVKRRHCHLDRLGQYLVNHDLTTPMDSTKDNHWQKLLEQNPCLQKHFIIIQRSKHSSLIQQHEHLKTAINNVFKTPEHAIGNMFQLKMVVSIGSMACNKLSMCLVDNKMVLISLIEEEFPDEFQLIQVFVHANKSDVKRKSVSFKSEEKINMRCLDVQFYVPDILSVLLEEQDDSKNAVILQVMTKSVYEHSMNKIDGSDLRDFVVMRQIPDLVASSFAVSGTRKVAIVLSESRRKVRLFEMEAEDEEEEEEMLMLEPSSSYMDSQKSYYKAMREGRLAEDDDGCLVVGSDNSASKDNAQIVEQSSADNPSLSELSD